MPYATQQQLIDRFGAATLVSLTDRAAVSTGTIDTAVVNAALTSTDAVIDGYLSSRYALPLVTIPALVQDVALAVAIYKLHAYAPDPKIDADYKDAMRTLRDIASGAVRLTVAGNTPAETGTSGAQITDRERPLTAENLKGFI
jgi:phage gp36-like protein